MITYPYTPVYWQSARTLRVFYNFFIALCTKALSSPYQSPRNAGILFRIFFNNVTRAGKKVVTESLNFVTELLIFITGSLLCKLHKIRPRFSTLCSLTNFGAWGAWKFVQFSILTAATGVWYNISCFNALKCSTRLTPVRCRLPGLDRTYGS